MSNISARGKTVKAVHRIHDEHREDNALIHFFFLRDLFSK